MTNIKTLEEQVAQQALLAEQAEQAVLQAREARAKAEQDLLEAMVKAEQEQADAEAMALKAKRQAEVNALKARRQVEKQMRALKVPKGEAKILERSYQRAGVGAGGTLLSSGARQATVTFKPDTFRLLELVAADNKVSLSEMVRQLVDRGLNPDA